MITVSARQQPKYAMRGLHGLRGLADPPDTADKSKPYYENLGTVGAITTFQRWVHNGAIWEKVGDPIQTTNLLGSGGASSGTTTSGGNTVPDVVKKTTPCPCRWEDVKTVKYLTDEPKPGAFPVMVKTSKWVCDQPTNVETKVLCDETNIANGGTPPDNSGDGITHPNDTQQNMNGLHGLGEITVPEVKYDGNVTVNSDKSGVPEWGKYAIGGAIGAGILYFALK